MFGPPTDCQFLALIAKYNYIEDEDLEDNYFLHMELELKKKLFQCFITKKQEINY